MTIPESKPTKLPLWKTVGDAYRLTWVHLGSLCRIAWLWVIIFIIFSVIAYHPLWPLELESRSNEKAILPLFALSLLPTIISLVMESSVSVAWHRLLLLNERTAQTVYLRLDHTVLRYFGRALILTLLFMVPLFLMILPTLYLIPDSSDIVGASISEDAPTKEMIETILTVGFLVLIGGLLLTVLSYVPMRLSLALPARALAHNQISWRESWRQTRWNYWRLFMGSVLTLALPLLLTIILTVILPETKTQIEYAYTTALFDALWFVGGIIWVSFLSLAYRHFFKELFE